MCDKSLRKTLNYRILVIFIERLVKFETIPVNSINISTWDFCHDFRHDYTRKYRCNIQVSDDNFCGNTDFVGPLHGFCSFRKLRRL